MEEEKKKEPTSYFPYFCRKSRAWSRLIFPHRERYFVEYFAKEFIMLIKRGTEREGELNAMCEE